MPPAAPFRETVDRYFSVSLYLLLLTGFATLATTGQLDAISFTIAAFALYYRGYLLWRNRERRIPERWSTWLTVGYVFVYVVDLFFLSGNFVTATVRLVLFGMVVKLFSVQRTRDYLYLAVLAFLMVLASAILTVDTTFLVAFAIFLLLAITTFVSLEMKRSLGQAGVVSQSSSGTPERRLPRALSYTGGALMAAIIVGSALVFFLLPRVSAGYFSSFAPRSELVSGFSDNVQLGQIGRIQQTDNIVMRVQSRTGGALPANLLWRGVSLASFDGHRWFNDVGTASAANVNGYYYRLAGMKLNDVPVFPPMDPQSQSRVQYRVVMEPMGADVFFLAGRPVWLRGRYQPVEVDIHGGVHNRDRRQVVINEYEAESDLKPPAQEIRRGTAREYPPALAITYLGLPRLDRRIPQLAQEVTAGAASDYERATRIEHHLRTQYGYTLQLLSRPVEDPLAHFLFIRRQGHCEYFASAMAVMLRSQGIPSRIVNGFRNGELNDITGSYVVRGRDAHSWVEAYFPGHGWISFDPTPPDTRTPTFGAMARMAMYMDAMREFWREWVINYDFSRQVQLSSTLNVKRREVVGGGRLWWKKNYRALINRLREAQAHVSRNWVDYTWRGLVVLALLVMALAGPPARRALRRRRLATRPELAPRAAASIWFEKLVAHLAGRGWPRQPAQTATEYAAQVPDPRLRTPIAEFVRHYERARFGGSTADAEALPHLYAQITRPPQKKEELAQAGD